MLDETTADGYVFRVDLRLRPDPGSTPVAISVQSAFSYYESVGQNWERAALIKARPVAGDLALGHSFLADLSPFIWRKYFDFAAIADIHAMKRQIHAVRGHESIAVAGTILRRGAGWFSSIGNPNNVGTKLFCVSGHVNTPCNVEEAMGITFRELIDRHCGGIRGGWDNLKAVIPGGSSVRMVPAHQIIDTPMDFDSLSKDPAAYVSFTGATAIEVTIAATAKPTRRRASNTVRANCPRP